MPYQQVRDCSIYYEDIGTLDPNSHQCASAHTQIKMGETKFHTILFLHSGYSRGIIAFSGQIQPFFHLYRCLFPDFRGHGRTRSENKDWDTPIIADDMADFLRALGIPRAHLIGYSLGGSVALHLAAKYPELVSSVITIGCGGAADPAGADEYEPEALIRSKQNAFIERIKTLHAEAHGGDWQHHVRQSARDWRMYPNLSDEDWSRLTMPMFFIGGEKDNFASPQKLAQMQMRCPQAKVWSVPGAGHGPHMPTEQARDVNIRMLEFLNAII